MAYPLSHLLRQLIGSPHTSLLDTITLDDLLRFVQVTRHLKKELSLHVPAGATDPPYRLPVYIHNALMFILQLSDTHVVYLWEALKHDIWTSEAMTLASLHESDIQQMNEYGKQVERPIESIGKHHSMQCYFNASNVAVKSLFYVLPTSLLLCRMSQTTAISFPFSLPCYLLLHPAWCSVSTHEFLVMPPYVICS